MKKKEKNKVFYLRGISFCNKQLKMVRAMWFDTTWFLVPFLVVTFLFDIEQNTGFTFGAFGGFVGSIGFAILMADVIDIVYGFVIYSYRKHCIKKVEKFNMNITCDKR